MDLYHYFTNVVLLTARRLISSPPDSHTRNTGVCPIINPVQSLESKLEAFKRNPAGIYTAQKIRNLEEVIALLQAAKR